VWSISCGMEFEPQAVAAKAVDVGSSQLQHEGGG